MVGESSKETPKKQKLFLMNLLRFGVGEIWGQTQA